MRIALCQMNPTVGDLAGNAAKIESFAARAREMDADLALFSELSLVGYPPKDLLLKSAFLADQMQVLERLAQSLTGITAVVGVAAPGGTDTRPLFNSAAVIRGGRVEAFAHKRLLPTYDVFDEERYFAAGRQTTVLEIAGRRVAITICEDAWNDAEFWRGRPYWWGGKSYPADPLAEAAAGGAEVILNLSASPFEMGKVALRSRMLAFAAKKHGLPVAFVNQVGGNDELVFDGSSWGFLASGECAVAAASFREDLVLFDTEAQSALEPQEHCDEEQVFEALVLGTRDYAHKCGFSRGIVGLSGGIDSALVGVVAARALGPGNVTGCLMPSMYSSEGSITDAEDLVGNLRLESLVVPIADVYHTFMEALKGPFGGSEQGLAEENLQARIRGTILMALSNKLGGLVLSTGNKSEVSVGYCTLYGDMVGGLDVLGDVPKTLVRRVARWVNRDKEVIPQASIVKPPSAELRPDQKDEDSLPPYELLDEILKLYVEEELGAAGIIERGYDAATVTRVVGMVDSNEYKRKQAAPVLKVTGRAFGFGRRMPIAQKYRHNDKEASP